jgi:hypothetical protein
VKLRVEEPRAVVKDTPRPSSSAKPDPTFVFNPPRSSTSSPTNPPTLPGVSAASTSPTTIVAPPVANVRVLPPETA